MTRVQNCWHLTRLLRRHRTPIYDYLCTTMYNQQQLCVSKYRYRNTENSKYIPYFCLFIIETMLPRHRQLTLALGKRLHRRGRKSKMITLCKPSITIRCSWGFQLCARDHWTKLLVGDQDLLLRWYHWPCIGERQELRTSLFTYIFLISNQMHYFTISQLILLNSGHSGFALTDGVLCHPYLSGVSKSR